MRATRADGSQQSRRATPLRPTGDGRNRVQFSAMRQAGMAATGVDVHAEHSTTGVQGKDNERTMSSSQPSSPRILPPSPSHSGDLIADGLAIGVASEWFVLDDNHGWGCEAREVLAGVGDELLLVGFGAGSAWFSTGHEGPTHFKTTTAPTRSPQSGSGSATAATSSTRSSLKRTCSGQLSEVRATHVLDDHAADVLA